MSVLVDTGVIYAHHDRDAHRHDAAVAAMDSLLDGAFGQPYVSDYVIDEALTLTRKRTNSFEAASGLADRLLGRGSFPRVFDVLYVGREAFQESLEAWHRYDDHVLSFTDATSVALCDRRGLDGIVTFDSDFDGLVSRIDPVKDV